MKPIQSYKDLEAWQQSLALVEECYRATRSFPVDERFELSAQLRRAAVSIASNIAEGHSRRSTRAYLNHVSIALGSQAELETELEIARRLGFVGGKTSEKLDGIARQVGRLLYGLHRAIQAKVDQAKE